MDDIVSRSYLSWPGTNKFFCDGKIMAGYALLSPDVHRAIITFFLILVPGIIFLSVPGKYFAEDYIFVPIVSALFLLLSLTFQVITSTTNPGFLPRQEPPFAVGPRGAPTLSFAMQQDPTKLSALDKGFFEYQVGGRLIKLKYCRTCTYYLGIILRPPRSSHCGDCDVCVEKFDHHCPWVGNCIGKRNYKFFMGFLYSTSSLIIFNLVFSIYHLAVVSDKAKDDGGMEAFQNALQKAGPTMFILLVALVMMWFVLGLTIFHTYLLFTGQTTNEIIKKSWKKSLNPYSKRSILKNIFSVICAKTFPMRFHARAFSPLTFQKYFLCPSIEATRMSEKFSEEDGKPEKYCDNNKTGGLVSPCDGISSNEPISGRFTFHDDKILINFK